MLVISLSKISSKLNNIEMRLLLHDWFITVYTGATILKEIPSNLNIISGGLHLDFLLNTFLFDHNIPGDIQLLVVCYKKCIAYLQTL